jgi:hypothetical protein
MSSQREAGKRAALRRDAAFDENDTVAYSGSGLAELLASTTMRAESALDADVEHTVILRGSHRAPPPVGFDTDPASTGASLPVAYTLSRSVAAQPPCAPRVTSGLGGRVSLAALGILSAFVVWASVYAEPYGEAPRLAGRTLGRQEHADEKTPLVSLTRAKFEARVEPKRHRRAPPSNVSRRASVQAAPGAQAAPAAAAPTRSGAAVADEELIRAAQLERSL